MRAPSLWGWRGSGIHLAGSLGRDDKAPSDRLGLDGLLSLMAIALIASSMIQLRFPIQHNDQTDTALGRSDVFWPIRCPSTISARFVSFAPVTKGEKHDAQKTDANAQGIILYKHQLCNLLPRGKADNLNKLSKETLSLESYFDTPTGFLQGKSGENGSNL